MSKAYIHTWFPKPLYIVEQLMPLEEVGKMETCVRDVFQREGWSGNGMLSVRSLHRTFDKLNTEPAFLPFTIAIMEHAKQFAKSIGYDETVSDRFYFKNMWSNISYEGDFNFPHVHGESLISGAYYIKGPPNSKIRFFNTIQSMMMAPTHVNEFNFEYCDYDCVTNNLIMFKSDFLHGNERQIEGEKIVVSFNIGVKD